MLEITPSSLVSLLDQLLVLAIERKLKLLKENHKYLIFVHMQGLK